MILQPSIIIYFSNRKKNIKFIKMYSWLYSTQKKQHLFLSSNVSVFCFGICLAIVLLLSICFGYQSWFVLSKF